MTEYQTALNYCTSILVQDKDLLVLIYVCIECEKRLVQHSEDIAVEVADSTVVLSSKLPSQLLLYFVSGVTQ